MKYLCLVYCDEGLLHSLPDSPADAECMAYAQALHGTGRMLAAEALKPVQTATTVRMRSGHMSLTDGPLVDARDLNEALTIAKGIPAARVGSVEVRPVRELQP
ncbi:MAG: dehydrogenase [Pseudomonas putida]|nr:MAG: dehydrogenase [Pseudomonas putida]